MIYDVIQEANYLVMDHINANMKVCGPHDLGLDPRAGGTFYVSEDGIGIKNTNRGSLEYYGGFEYVRDDCVLSAGDYTFYLAEDDRVRDHIETYFESEGLCTSE